jgi:hypothetical protein
MNFLNQIPPQDKNIKKLENQKKDKGKVKFEDLQDLKTPDLE